mgnify:CR=1 FL=1
MRRGRRPQKAAEEHGMSHVEIVLDAIDYLSLHAPWRRVLGIDYPYFLAEVQQVAAVRKACARHADDFIRANPEASFWDRRKITQLPLEQMRAVARFCANRKRPAAFAEWCKAEGHIARSIAA